MRSDVKRAAVYGAALAGGALLLQWLDYRRLARSSPGEVYLFLVAFAFLLFGLWLGRRLFAPPPPARFAGNPQAQAALGISARELAVLHALAEGRTNKEIARELGISPNTIKTHVARLFEKLDASRRTDAINKARQLGILP